MAMKTCCYAVCAVVVVVVNILLAVIGLLFMAFGGILLFGRSLFEQYVMPNVKQLLDVNVEGMNSTGMASTNSIVESIIGGALDFFQPLATGLFICGIIIFFIAIFGCCGACCRNKCCLIVYVIVVGIIFVIQLILLIVYGAGRKKYNKEVEAYMYQTLKNDFTGIDNANFATLLWNLMQVTNKCCGVHNGTDFEAAKAWKRNRTAEVHGIKKTIIFKYPISCCKMESGFTPLDRNCTIDPTPKNNNYQTGCLAKAVAEGDVYYGYMLSAIGVLFALQFVLLMCAVVLLFVVMTEKDD